MERLIEQVYEQYLIKDLDVVGIGGKNARALDRVAEKLYEYEQAEEEGRLLVLPCKIGTVLYDAELPKFPQRVIGYRIGRMMGEDEEDFDEDHEMETLYMESEGCGISMSSLTLDIGKNIFLTREGAEAKRKEMEESK